VEQRVPRSEETVDVLFVEPVYCDGQFGVLKLEDLPRTRRIVVLDTTMVGPDYDMSPWLRADAEDGACPLVIAFSSGLKLDQAGLELANVGIIELIEPEPAQGQPFLRVAMGWRGGYSCTGLCNLFAELAAYPSFADLAKRMGLQ
jgi:hypothetical protein